jgi:hypothetical protein
MEGWSGDGRRVEVVDYRDITPDFGDKQGLLYRIFGVQLYRAWLY